MSVNRYKTKAGFMYQAILYVNSQRVASKAGFQTKKDARKWLLEEEQNWQRSRNGMTTTHTDFETLASAYLSEIEDRRKRNTYVYKRGTFRRVLSFFNFRLPLNEITRTVLAEYLRIQKDTRGPKAANRDLKELITIFNWAVRHDFMLRNPARAIEPYAEESYVRYVPPAEDIAAARLAATKEERRILDTLYYTAARLSEVLNLTWEDVNFEARALRLWTSKRRGGNREPRVLAMHQELHALLWDVWQERDTKSSYVFNNPLTGTKYHRVSAFIRTLFPRICARAGLEKPFTAHCIRHHVASRLADSRKATHRQIQQFLGHMNLRTTETYLHELQVDRDILAAFDVGDEETKERKTIR
jgi:integrase